MRRSYPFLLYVQQWRNVKKDVVCQIPTHHIRFLFSMYSNECYFTFSLSKPSPKTPMTALCEIKALGSTAFTSLKM